MNNISNRCFHTKRSLVKRHYKTILRSYPKKYFFGFRSCSSGRFLKSRKFWKCTSLQFLSIQYSESRTQNFQSSALKNILQIITDLEETLEKKLLIDSKKKIILSISGGQDSVFLLFCLSFLQSQLAFKKRLIWCNHFWQSCSFYTTLHLTRSAVAFSFPMIAFLPLQLKHSRSLHTSHFLRMRITNRRFVKGTASLLLGFALAKPNFLCFARSCCTNRRFVQHERGQAKASAKISNICTKEKIKVKHAYKSAIFKADATKGQRKAKASLLPKLCLQREKLYTQNKPLTTLRVKTKRKIIALPKFVENKSENRARNWRHIATERACTFYESNRAIYGHTASDRIETILFNLMRGAGNRGVKSLPWKRDHSTFCYNNFYLQKLQFIENTHISVMHIPKG